MQTETFLLLLARWTHILSVVTLAGGILFLRLVLLPATGAGPGEAVNRRFGMVVRVCATLLLLSGGYTFWRVNARDPGSTYHALFGVKVMLALGVFFLASVLVGRARAFEAMRRNLGTWLFLTVLLVVGVVLVSGLLRYV
jgi:uncharacterized membrane protein